MIGPFYDFLATLFSCGKIDECKCCMHDYITPDSKVLFAGVGHGVDACLATRVGADVSVIDLSQTMLEKLKDHIQRRSITQPIRIIEGDVLEFSEFESFDVVFANFFLNVFGVQEVKKIEKHLAKLVKPGGYLVVGDFTLPSGGFLKKLMQNIYWYIACLTFFAATGNALHSVHPYLAHLKQLNWQIEKVTDFRLIFDSRYTSILAKKR